MLLSSVHPSDIERLASRMCRMVRSNTLHLWLLCRQSCFYTSNLIMTIFVHKKWMLIFILKKSIKFTIELLKNVSKYKCQSWIQTNWNTLAFKINFRKHVYSCTYIQYLYSVQCLTVHRTHNNYYFVGTSSCLNSSKTLVIETFLVVRSHALLWWTSWCEEWDSDKERGRATGENRNENAAVDTWSLAVVRKGMRYFYMILM